MATLNRYFNEQPKNTFVANPSGGKQCSITVGDYVYDGPIKTYQKTRQMLPKMTPINSMDVSGEPFIADGNVPHQVNDKYLDGFDGRGDFDYSKSAPSDLPAAWPIQSLKPLQKAALLRIMGSQTYPQQKKAEVVRMSLKSTNEPTFHPAVDMLKRLAVTSGPPPEFDADGETEDQAEYIDYMAVQNCVHNLIDLQNWSELKRVVSDLDEQSEDDIFCDLCGGWVACSHLKRQRLQIPIVLWTKKYNESLFCIQCNEKMRVSDDTGHVSDLSDHYDPAVVQIYQFAIFSLSQILGPHSPLGKIISEGYIEYIHNVIMQLYVNGSKAEKNTDIKIGAIYHILLFGVYVLKEKDTGALKLKTSKNVMSKDLRTLEPDQIMSEINLALQQTITQFFSMSQVVLNQVLPKMFHDSYASIMEIKKKNIETVGNAFQSAYKRRKDDLDKVQQSLNIFSYISRRTGLSEEGINKTFATDLTETPVYQKRDLEINPHDYEAPTKHTPRTMNIIGSADCPTHNWDKKGVCGFCQIRYQDVSEDDSEYKFDVRNKHIISMLLIKYADECPLGGSHKSTTCSQCGYPTIDETYIEQFGSALFDVVVDVPTAPETIKYENPYSHIRNNEALSGVIQSVKNYLPKYEPHLLVVVLKSILRIIMKTKELSANNKKIDQLSSLGTINSYIITNKISVSVLNQACGSWDKHSTTASLTENTYNPDLDITDTDEIAPENSVNDDLDEDQDVEIQGLEYENDELGDDM